MSASGLAGKTSLFSFAPRARRPKPRKDVKSRTYTTRERRLGDRREHAAHPVFRWLVWLALELRLASSVVLSSIARHLSHNMQLLMLLCLSCCWCSLGNTCRPPASVCVISTSSSSDGGNLVSTIATAGWGGGGIQFLPFVCPLFVLRNVTTVPKKL